MPQVFAVAFCLTVAILGWIWIRSSRARLPLPPSPRGWPLVGHIFQINTPEPWKAYHEWCNDLGSSIIHLNMAGRDVIVLDTYEDCVELLEKRSATHSGRMPMPMVNELMGWSFNFAWMAYGLTWRERKRLMHESFNPDAAKSFRPLHLQFARELLLQLRDTDDILKELRHLSGKTVITIAYGIKIKPVNDPYIEAAEQGNSALLNAAVPGKFLVDSIPILKHIPEWVPGASFKRKARQWKEITMTMLDMPFDAFLNNLRQGEALPSLAYRAYQQLSDTGIYTHENIKAVSGTMYQTGSDTTMAVMGFCIRSLLDRPDIVKKIHAEIDAVTEKMRLPDFRDEGALPYLEAVIHETMRYWSFVPLSVPHAATNEDHYKGYRIPCAAILVPNIWAILHNEKIFPAPFEFKPERFLDTDNLEERLNHLDAIWGFGRRACSGRRMAFAMVWVTLAQIFAVYDLSKAKDEYGNVIEPLSDIIPSILLLPPNYRCRFTLRSKEAEELLAGISDSA